MSYLIWYGLDFLDDLIKKDFNETKKKQGQIFVYRQITNQIYLNSMDHLGTFFSFIFFRKKPVLIFNDIIFHFLF